MALLKMFRAVVIAGVFAGVVATTDATSSASDPLSLSRPAAAGAAHSLAIDPSGAVWSWGQNLLGQLGTGDHLSRTIPTRVANLPGAFVAVSAGVGHSLALRNDGVVFAWGLNLEGQLGIGNNVTKVTPARVTSLSNVVAIAAGGAHSLAATADGSIWAWGDNSLGQVGDGTATRRRVPVRVTALSQITAVEAGTTHSLALRSDGTVWSWGGNASGQLGTGTSTLQRRPVRVSKVLAVKAIAAGAMHSLAVTDTGGVWAWGLNSAGQLGDASTTTRRTPVKLAGIPPIAAIAAGGAHSLAITTNATALGWGDNAAGQIGDGSTTRRLSPAATSHPPSVITAIAAGGAHTVALAGDVAVWTWGSNLLAQLGDGTRHPRTRPVPISGPNVTWGAYPPLFSPPGGTFPMIASVTLSTPTPDAVIHYTLDGIDPTESHPVFASPIQIAVTTTVRARAFRSGLAPSLVSMATYTIGSSTLAMPVAIPPAGTYPQAQAITLTADTGTAIRYSLDGSDPSLASPLFEGAISIVSTTTLRARAFKTGFTASDILSAHYVIDPSVPAGEDPPPDPAAIATPLSDTSLTGFATAYGFLFSGSDPIQRDHTQGSIAADRMAVVRGRVVTREGEPLPGVRVTPKAQPGAGHTVTRADGMFDLAVNGGGPVTIEYTRNGFLPAQRIVDTPWQDFAAAPDVRLVRLDAVVTPVTFEPRGISTAARGSVSADDSGSRQATIVVPDNGVMVTIHLPDGTIMPGVSRLSIRATEYTVGTGGPEAMPAPLPATSGYTYAVELTADEALQAAATNVTFDPPLALYLENFLNFPVGSTAPTGYYDRARSKWIPSHNGRVIGIVGVNAAGEAELDVDGAGLAADAMTLAALGVTPGERKRIALLYAPGQSLWRSSIPHFSTWDVNWPFGPPGDAEAPNLDGEDSGQDAPGTRATQRTGQRSGADGQADAPSCVTGSIIECQNQTLGERLPIAGTPFALAYRSDRVFGYAAARTVSIPLTNTAVPDSLKRVDLEITVAGQKHRFAFAPAPGQSTSFTWNGLDAYGRSIVGQQLAVATVGHVYDGVYYDAPSTGQDFAAPPQLGAPVVGDRARAEVSVQQRMVFGVEARHPAQAPVAGWDISEHHRYDARSGVLFMGDGDQRAASAVGDVITAVAGGGETPVDASPVPAREALLTDRVVAVAAAADGSIYFTDAAGVLRLASGTVTRIVRFGQGDGGDGDKPGLAARGDTVVYAYGDVEGDCSEGGSYTALRVRRLTPNGPGEELAVTTGPLGFTPCSGGTQVAIGTDGSVFLGAGFTAWVIPPGTSPVKIGTFSSPVLSLAAGPAGSVYIGALPHVHQWRADGSLRVVAGNGMVGNEGDGGAALEAPLGFSSAMVADGDGNLLIASNVSGTTLIRVVRANGTIEWYAGRTGPGTISDGSPGRAAPLGSVRGMALAPDGGLYLSASNADPLLMRLRPLSDATRVASGDGSSVYEFDPSGRHLRTVDALTGVALSTFAYDTAGRLTGITDRHGFETRIIRDGAGAPHSIVNPFGVETSLTIGAGGYLSSVADADGRTTTLAYRDGGLLTSLLDANGGMHTFDYDAGGRLLLDADPAGGTQTLSRSGSVKAWAVTRDAADAGTTTYVTQQGANGIQTRRVVAPDGTETVSLNRGNGTTIITAPDGTEATTTLAPDPRFGLAAPVASTAIRTPAGLTMTVTRSRSVALSDPENPLSVVSHTETTTLNGRVLRSVFDAAAGTITSISPANRRVVTTLDALGRPSSVQVGTLILPTTFTYDAHGRLATQTQGARTTTFAYDERGFLGSFTDPLSRTVQFTNDVAGRRLSQTFPDLREATFSYDANGNLTSLTPPGRPAHTMHYTPANLLDEYTAPGVDAASTTTRYQFNRARQPVTVTRADGQQISWTYDAAGRPATLITPAGSTTFAFHPVTGQLTSLTSPSGGLAYSYDGALQTAENASGFATGSVAWDYDSSFRVATERVNGANAVTFAYDADSLLTRAGTLNYTRRAADGLLLTATLGSAVTTFTYSDFGELATEETRRGTTVLHRGVYTRDNGGRLTVRTETIGGTTTTDGYGYDLAGRLTTVTRGGVPVATYTYDANGNRASVTTSAGTIAAAYDDQDRILTFGDRTYTHTAHGEVRSWTDPGGTTTLSYDVHGNLLAVNLASGTTVEYVVDARNRRIGRKVNGAVTHRWLYQDQLRPVAELDAGGALVTRYVYGARAVAPEYMIRGGVTYRLITDQLGSVRLVVNIANGAIAQRIDYDAWGQVVVDSSPGFQPFGFAGGLRDPSTGLVRFGVRDYDTLIGRWLSKDPIVFEGGDVNLYAYSHSIPNNINDPSGLAVPLIGVGIGVVVGATSGAAGAMLQGGSTKTIVAAAVIGGAAGAVTAGAATSAALMGLTGLLTESIGQLLGMIGCPTKSFSVIGAAAAFGTGFTSARVGFALAGQLWFSSSPLYLQELFKGLLVLPMNTLVPAVVSAVDSRSAQDQ